MKLSDKMKALAMKSIAEKPTVKTSTDVMAEVLKNIRNQASKGQFKTTIKVNQHPDEVQKMLFRKGFRVLRDKHKLFISWE